MASDGLPDSEQAGLSYAPSGPCIRVVTPDDHVACGYHEILLHDMGEQELPFVSLVNWTTSVVFGRGLYSCL